MPFEIRELFLIPIYNLDGEATIETTKDTNALIINVFLSALVKLLPSKYSWGM